MVFLSNTRKWQIQWKLSWETTALRDHLSWQTTHFWQDLHFNRTEKPVTKDHLSWQTTILWPMGRSFKTGSTVLPSKLCYMMLYSFFAGQTLSHWSVYCSYCFRPDWDVHLSWLDGEKIQRRRFPWVRLQSECLPPDSKHSGRRKLQRSCSRLYVNLRCTL